MARYAVVEQSTDLRWRSTKIRITRSLKVARSLRKGSGRYTCDDPEAERNWHRTFVEVYELPVGWRKPPERQLKQQAQRESTSTYPVTALDVLAGIIRAVGKKVQLRETVGTEKE
ncbi:MAG: hypothetical protein QJR06_11060 [Alicyclobacillaceae bacterium]|nr:hypothetical protein [Alicyclobacillaceae bacterium]